MSNEMININKKKPIIGLDFLRFFAAFSVLMFHFTNLTNRRGDDIFINSNLLSFPEISFFTSYGWLGVEIFFLISGFVISAICIIRLEYSFVNQFSIVYKIPIWLESISCV